MTAPSVHALSEVCLVTLACTITCDPVLTIWTDSPVESGMGPKERQLGARPQVLPSAAWDRLLPTPASRISDHPGQIFVDAHLCGMVGPFPARMRHWAPATVPQIIQPSPCDNQNGVIILIRIAS